MYASIAQFIEAFGQQEASELSYLDDDSQAGINTAVLERALNDASSEMDSYFGFYPLPFVSPPKVCIGCCLDIARHRLDRVREREDVRKRYEDWRDWLRLVAQGKVKLGLSVEEVKTLQPAIGEVWSRRSDYVYTNESLAGF